MAVGVGSSKQRSYSISLEVDQQVVVIEETNPPSEMKRVVIPSKYQEQTTD